MNNAISAGQPIPNEVGTVAEQADYVRRRLKESITHVQRNRRANLRRASLVRIGTILLSGVATVLLGLEISDKAEDIMKQGAFVLGASVTMLNALEPFFNFRSLWVEHERALAALYQLDSDFEFYLAGNPASQIQSSHLQSFHQRHQQVWNELSSAWIRARISTKNNDSV